MSKNIEEDNKRRSEERLKLAQDIVKNFSKTKVNPPLPDFSAKICPAKKENTAKSTQDKEALEKARYAAIKYIGIDKGKSSGKVRQKLKEEGFPDETIECTIQTLEADDYISDYRACAKIARRHQGSRQKSRRFLEDLFKTQGVKDTVAEEYAAALPADEVSIKQLLERERNPLSEADKQRLIRRYMGRGYNYYTIKNAMEDISK